MDLCFKKTQTEEQIEKEEEAEALVPENHAPTITATESVAVVDTKEETASDRRDAPEYT